MVTGMKRVIIESPYAGDIERNRQYLTRCIRDSIDRGEAPFASHGFYTLPGILDDSNPLERELGIAMGYTWSEIADIIAIYIDHGISGGMRAAIDRATAKGYAVEYRRLKSCQAP